MLIDAMAQLSTDSPTRLMIVGDGPEKPNLEKKVEDLGLADVVQFRSDVEDNAEVFALMKAAASLCSLGSRRLWHRPA